jgi:hypothetical protein
MENKIGMIGFLCPNDNKEYSFDYCIGSCPNKCISIPLLRALIKESHVVEKRYSVTEIMNPPQMVYLKRHYGYYVSPEQRIWAIFGNAVHLIISAYSGIDPAVDGFSIEEKFETKIGDCILVGKADLYDINAKELTDYKTIKSFAVKKMKEGDWEENNYLWQLNIYKWFHFRDAEKLTLECLIKDWSEEIQFREDIHPVERINVPILPESKVTLAVQEKIIEHEKNHNDPTLIRPCTKPEVWFNKNPRSRNCGRPVRCDKYCDVCKLCPQYNTFLQDVLDGETDAIKDNIYPTR